MTADEQELINACLDLAREKIRGAQLLAEGKYIAKVDSDTKIYFLEGKINQIAMRILSGNQ